MNIHLLPIFAEDTDPLGGVSPVAVATMLRMQFYALIIAGICFCYSYYRKSRHKRAGIVARISSLNWTPQDFCQHFLITGATGWARHVRPCIG